MDKGFLIWDMDGTLVDSSYGITQAVNGVRATKGLGALSVVDIVRFINEPHLNLAQIFYETATFEKGDTKLFEEIYWEQCLERMAVYEGVYEAIETLYAQRWVMSVATNASTKFAQKILEHVKLAPFFKAIVGADKVSHPKPSEEILHHVAQMSGTLLGAQYDVMIGDGIKDMVSAKNGGVTSIHVTWGYSSLKEGFDYQCSSPKMLKELLNTILCDSRSTL